MVKLVFISIFKRVPLYQKNSMAHLSNASQMNEIMKRWLFIVLIFSVIFNQFVVGAPQQIVLPTSPIPPTHTMPTGLAPGLSPYSAPLYGFRSNVDGLAGAVDNLGWLLSAAARTIVTGATNFIANTASMLGGSWSSNMMSHSVYGTQLTPQQPQQPQMNNAANPTQTAPAQALPAKPAPPSAPSAPDQPPPE